MKPCRRRLLPLVLAGLVLALARVPPGRAAESQARMPPAAFSNVAGESFAARTPRGLFSCENSAATDHRQVLKLDGRILYRQPARLDRPEETDRLRDGIIHDDIGCPRVLGGGDGFVVLVRNLQPPQYGVQGYLAVNFREDDPYLIDLGTGYRPEDDAIPDERRLRWMDGGLVLRYFGDLPDSLAAGGASRDPPRANRTILFNFAESAPQDGDACLPLKDTPLFGDLADLVGAPDPSRRMPEGVRIGASKTRVLAILERHGRPYDPDETGEGSGEPPDRLTIPVCGNAGPLGAYPLFLFRDGKLEAIRFEAGDGQDDE
ncbi:hypothetical protein CDEN61S_02131 [Castellaniella denitrificans]